MATNDWRLTYKNLIADYTEVNDLQRFGPYDITTHSRFGKSSNSLEVYGLLPGDFEGFKRTI